MSDVIRKAIIELEVRQKRSRLEAPGAADTAGFKAQAEAAGKAEQAVDKSTAAVKRHAEVVRSSTFSVVKDFREAGEGVFKMTRGLALLASSGSDDLKKLVQQVVIAQGAFDVFSGGFKTISNLASRLGGPAAAGVTAVSAALGIGALAWGRWRAAAEEAALKVEESIRRTEELLDKVVERRAGRDLESRGDRGASIGISLTDDTRAARLRDAIRQEGAVVADTQRGIREGEALRDVEGRGIHFAAQENRRAEQAIKNRLDLEQELFRVEQQRDASRQSQLNDVLRGVGSTFGFNLQLPQQSLGFDKFTKELQATMDSLLRQMQQYRERAQFLENLANKQQSLINNK